MTMEQSRAIDRLVGNSMYLHSHKGSGKHASYSIEVLMKLALALVLTFVSMQCIGQSAAKTEVFAAAQISRQFIELAPLAKAKGSSGFTLGEYGTHSVKLSERTASGGAEIHAHFDDVFLVLEGKATLITGGEEIDPPSGTNGETTAIGIRNGIVQKIAAGDVGYRFSEMTAEQR